MDIIKILDSESPKQIASHINNGEISLTEANNLLVDSVKGITDSDKEEIELYFKRAKKLDDSIVYLDC